MIECNVAVKNDSLDYLMIWKNISDMLSENGEFQKNITPIQKIKKKKHIYTENRLKGYTPKC